MAWSSFAHLPTSEEDYYYILSNIRNGMSNQDIDSVIATYKGKDTVQHHYRSNLARIGVFKSKDNCITLSYNVKKLIKSKRYLKDILRKALAENNSTEINDVMRAITMSQSYDLMVIVATLEKKYPLIERSSFIRWVRPIIALFKIIDFLSQNPQKENQYALFLQESYLKTTNDFNHSVPLDEVEIELKKIDESFNIVIILDSILDNLDYRFKIELLMLPSWATKNKSYKVGQDLYTHIKVKSDLLKEDKK